VKPSIKPGCLCLVSGMPAEYAGNVVRNGAVLTAVKFIGSAYLCKPSTGWEQQYMDVWAVTDLPAPVLDSRLGCSAKWLTPISDPDIDIAGEERQRQLAKKLRHAMNYSTGPLVIKA